MMHRRLRAATALVAVACVALALALLADNVQPRAQRVELTYWDGAAADEPGYAEEAGDQIDTGLYGYHLGYWESPGYWNNRGLADGAESQMDARMFHDAATNGYFVTGGADFFDTDSLFNDATDADSVSLDGTYDNTWPGTGDGLFGYDNVESASDAYDGQFEVDPLDMEATSDAGVSGNDIGFKAVGSPQSQMLVQCDRCYGGADCVAGCRMPAASKVASINSKQERAAKRQKQAPAPSSVEKSAAHKIAKRAHMHAGKSKIASVKGVAKKQTALAKVVEGNEAPRAMEERQHDHGSFRAKFGGLGGFSPEGWKELSHQGLLCGRMACEMGGLWGKACGCTLIEERRAREARAKEEAAELKERAMEREKKQRARAKEEAEAEERGKEGAEAIFEEKEKEEEHEAEEEEEDEEKQKWLGLHGIVLDASPLAERWMPEQRNDIIPPMQSWKTFWSNGHKMQSFGVKV